MTNKFEEIKSALEKIDSGKLGVEKECRTVKMPDLDDFSLDLGSYTIGSLSTANVYSSYPTTQNMGNITINSGGSSSSSSSGAGTGYNWTTSASGPFTISSGYESSKISIDGEGADVLINGKSLTAFMKKMEDRLAILQPDLEKLEHFDALKKAYEHYKTLEAMCELPKKEEDGS